MTAPAVVRRGRQPAPGSVVRGRRGGPAALGEHAVPPRRRAPLAALLASGLVVHAAVVPHLAVRGVQPDVLLVAVVAVAAVRGERTGAAFGFATGLGADLFLATPLGTSALSYTLVGHVVGLRAKVRHPMVLALAGVAGGRLATAAAGTALGGLPFPETAGLLRMIGVAALSAGFGPPMVALVRRLSGQRGARR